MKFIFKEKYTNGTRAESDDYYSNLNGVDSDIFFAEQHPDKFKDCFAIIGGFTDRCFFVKEKIKSLIDTDKTEFMDYIKTSQKDWDTMVGV
jgi:hypothetical protein